ncbi:hypothetical protein YW3DRAFT_06531 [Streptomyces sp. MnatMP-M77]|nr:hypothetical protein YW3DRAFT_06531 [Streptomyces sp. MnatMP-M77]
MWTGRPPETTSAANTRQKPYGVLARGLAKRVAEAGCHKSAVDKAINAVSSKTWPCQ